MRYEWLAEGCETFEVYQSNADHSCSLGLPFVTPGTRGSLAVAGGGPSLARNLDKLNGYDEVWGINRTAQWLCERGVPATFFTVDPQYVPGMTDVDRAIVASCVHPKVFEELAGKDVSLFHIHRIEGRSEFVAEGGPSSACRAIPVAVHMGYSSVTFFGCEGSYDGGSHAYASDVQDYRLVIRSAGRDYVTQPDYQMQCEWLAPFLVGLPQYFREESGGLLRAMIADPDWQHVGISPDLALRLVGDVTSLPKYEGIN